MGYRRFTAEIEVQIVERQKQGLPALQNDEYLYAARDVWLRQGRLSELVSFTLENWDSGNGDEFMRPVVDARVAARQVTLLKMLLSESLLGVAHSAYASKTDRVMPRFSGAPPRLQGTAWSEATLTHRYPELSALFARQGECG